MGRGSYDTTGVPKIIINMGRGAYDATGVPKHFINLGRGAYDTTVALHPLLNAIHSVTIVSAS
jgi:hypothetical protein